MSVFDHVTALVPMRHHSERVPGKNYRPFAGRPLYHWILEALLETRAVDVVVVDTDSERIAREIDDRFPRVLVLERPPHLRAGDLPMNDVIRHDLDVLPGDVFLQTHSTNPLLRTETIDRAITALGAAFPHHDALFTATRRQVRLWDDAGRPLNHDPAVLLRTQDLPPVFEENSALYVFSREAVEKYGSRLGARPMLFELDAVEAWDIDEELQFSVGEFLFEKRMRGEI